MTLFTRSMACTAILAALAGCRSRTASSGTDAGWQGLSFVEDDYDRALARARSNRRPLFVDAWAPWCHTCLSMKAYVFGDPALAPLASAFVWASVDTEKATSEPFLRKFPMKNWPTLWVVDAATEKPVLKWAGSVTASELVLLLKAATEESTAPGSAEAAAAWMRGNQAAADGRRDVAIAEYETALGRAPTGWSGRSRTVDALASQLAAAHDPECVSLCLREWPSLGPGTARLDVALAALGCAEDLPKDASERAAIADLAKGAARIAVDPAEPVLADDRSSLFEELIEFYRTNGDKAEALALGRKWRDFLDGEAARAPSPAARAVFDSHRLLAYEAVGEPEKAIPMLELSEREFPDDYNPPTRLAKVLLDTGRLDASLAAVRRAEARVYGPRSLRVLAIEADVWAAMGKPREQKAALERAVTLGEKLGVTGGNRDLLENLKRQADAL